MALDCENAFNQEMAVLNGINDKLDTIKTYLTPKPNEPIPQGLEAKIDETNRLLKFLCENLLGASK